MLIFIMTTQIIILLLLAILITQKKDYLYQPAIFIEDTYYPSLNLALPQINENARMIRDLEEKGIIQYDFTKGKLVIKNINN
jgi:hypothetical protein